MCLIDSFCFLCLLLWLTVFLGYVLDLLQTLQVAAGGMHSLALTADHQVYSTGVNDEGALGRYTGECAACR